MWALLTLASQPNNRDDDDDDGDGDDDSQGQSPIAHRTLTPHVELH
ncbi:hypothetical protein VDGD_21300 [Verticillium dahliae]|nr:hypothetical protein VDGD_21300 [Verticillium dahliae]